MIIYFSNYVSTVDFRFQSHWLTMIFLLSLKDLNFVSFFSIHYYHLLNITDVVIMFSMKYYQTIATLFVISIYCIDKSTTKCEKYENLHFMLN